MASRSRWTFWSIASDCLRHGSLLSTGQALTHGLYHDHSAQSETIMFGSFVSQIALVATIWLWLQLLLRPHTKSQLMINCWDMGA